MLPLAGRLLGTLRLTAAGDREDCLVCARPIRRSEERMRVPGGGQVHRDCATYRMRRHAHAVRRIGSH